MPERSHQQNVNKSQSLCGSCKGPEVLPRTPGSHSMVQRPNSSCNSSPGSTPGRVQSQVFRGSSPCAITQSLSVTGWTCSQLGLWGSWLALGCKRGTGSKARETSPGRVCLMIPNPENPTANSQCLKKQQTTGHKGSRGV